MIPTHLEAYGYEALSQRLLNKRSTVHVRPDLTPCWEWTGSRYRDGYGYMYLASPIRRRYSVHRLAGALWLADFDLDSSLVVLHECDNPSCFNPDHLRPGTCKENVHDARDKGRLYIPPPRRGAENGNAKLSEFEVVAIRKAYASGGTTHRRLAEQFGVSSASVARVVRGETWATAPGPITRHDRIGEGNVMARLTEADVAEIRGLVAAGDFSIPDLSAQFGVSHSTMSGIVSGQSWRRVAPPAASHGLAAA